MKIRKATPTDLNAIADIYNAIHDQIERGEYNMKWFRDKYPTKSWADEHIEIGDIYVLENAENKVVASAIFNHNPLPEYFQGCWHQPQTYDDILIVHTLVVHPEHVKKGYATTLINYYEDMARNLHCNRLRLDTQEIDIPARRLYQKLGYTETDFLPCQFKGINDIALVLIEKII